MSVDRTALIDILERIPLEASSFVLAGSAPMLVAGLIDEISDVDIVVGEAAWEQALAACERPPREGLFGDHLLEMVIGRSVVEIFDGWLGIDAGVILAEAIRIAGYRFMPLRRVAESKRRLGRPKDLEHLRLIVDSDLTDEQ